MILNNKKNFLSLMGILIVLFFTGCKNNDELGIMSKTSTINKVVSENNSTVLVRGKNISVALLLANKLLLEKEVYVDITVSEINQPVILLFENAQSQVSKRIIYPGSIFSFREKVKVENSGIFYSKENNQSIFKISITTDKGFFSYSKEVIKFNITRIILPKKSRQFLKYQKYLKRYTNECNNKNTESCVHLADMYYKGISVEKDIEKAKKILLKACDIGNGQACNNLAWIVESENDLVNAHKFYAQACNKEYKMACSNLGFLYENSIGVKRDIKKAKKLYKEACDAGHQIACANLTKLTKKEKRIKKAKAEVEKEEKECMNKESKSCAYLGVRYFNGNGLFVDMKKAKAFYEKACDGGNMMSCSNLGLMYATGKGVRVNKEKALNLLTKACKNWNSTIGCANLEFVKNNNIGISYWSLKSNE
jgi:TPR repeat protein